MGGGNDWWLEKLNRLGREKDDVNRRKQSKSD